MKTYNKSTNISSNVRNLLLLLDVWQQQYVEAMGIPPDGPNRDNPDFYHQLSALLWEHIDNPDNERALADLQSLNVTWDAGSKMLAEFEKELSAAGWNVCRARENAAKRMAYTALFRWADQAVRKIVKSGEISVPEAILEINPRFQIHLTSILLYHLGTRNEEATTLAIGQKGCSGDIAGLIRAFEKAWLEYLCVTIRTAMTSEERERFDLTRELILRAQNSKATGPEAEDPGASIDEQEPGRN